MKQSLLITFSIVMLALSTASMAKDFSKEDIEYIQKNPEVILDSVEAYGQGQHQADAQKRQEMIDQHIGWLDNNDMLPVAGNPNGDVTVVEFFDYNCGYCKKALNDITTLMDRDKNVKFVFVEMPILGRTSELAAKWALAAQKQDAYMEYHIGLMKNRGPLNELSFLNIAKKIGLDVEQLQKDAASDEIANKVKEKSKKASQMGISGTPAFIIDGKLYAGYVGLEKMEDAIKNAREGQ